MKCGYQESDYYQGLDKNNPAKQKKHKVFLLDKEFAQIDSDTQALEKRIENLKIIIENEKGTYKQLLEKLKGRSFDVSQKYSEMHKKVWEAIAKEERKRLKELAMLGSNLIRINVDLTKKIEYLNHLKKIESTSSYVSALIVYKNYIENDLTKNLLCLEKKILEYNIKYVSKNPA